MKEKKATEIFSQWVLDGKDEGMEKNHSNAVNVMLDEIIGSQTDPFSIIDAGCGNGWVVRKIINHPLCEKAIGVDGSKEMIDKARSLDSDGTYFCSDLMDWSPKEKVNFVHSMEVLYYLREPEKFIMHILENWLLEKGTIIIGIDHYLENLNSHSWPTDLNTYMNLKSIQDWIKLFKGCGVSQIVSFQTNESQNFPGTLVLKGEK
ncbi:MAG: class I SAM-dependent methyltransferase [Candidatus Neomarinimicrobiota bacterium]